MFSVRAFDPQSPRRVAAAVHPPVSLHRTPIRPGGSHQLLIAAGPQYHCRVSGGAGGAAAARETVMAETRHRRTRLSRPGPARRPRLLL